MHAVKYYFYSISKVNFCVLQKNLIFGIVFLDLVERAPGPSLLDQLTRGLRTIRGYSSCHSKLARLLYPDEDNYIFIYFHMYIEIRISF